MVHSFATQLKNREVEALGTSQIFKRTRMCVFYLNGKCGHGSSCDFAHGATELQQEPDLHKTRICFRFMKKGVCKAGDDCKYAHGSQELREEVVSDTSTQASTEPVHSEFQEVASLVANMQMHEQAASAARLSLYSLLQSRAAAVQSFFDVNDSPMSWNGEALKENLHNSERLCTPCSTRSGTVANISETEVTLQGYPTKETVVPKWIVKNTFLELEECSVVQASARNRSRSV